MAPRPRRRSWPLGIWHRPGRRTSSDRDSTRACDAPQRLEVESRYPCPSRVLRRLAHCSGRRSRGYEVGQKSPFSTSVHGVGLNRGCDIALRLAALAGAATVATVRDASRAALESSATSAPSPSSQAGERVGASTRRLARRAGRRQVPRGLSSDPPRAHPACQRTRSARLARRPTMTRRILAAVPLAAALALSALPAAAQDEVTPADEVEPSKSVTGTITEGEDGVWYLTPEGGDPIELQFGPSWFHDLTALFDLFDGQTDVDHRRQPARRHAQRERLGPGQGGRGEGTQESGSRRSTTSDATRASHRGLVGQRERPAGQAKKAAERPAGPGQEGCRQRPAGPGQEGRVTSGCDRGSASDRRSRPKGRLLPCPAACGYAPVTRCVRAPQAAAK